MSTFGIRESAILVSTVCIVLLISAHAGAQPEVPRTDAQNVSESPVSSKESTTLRSIDEAITQSKPEFEWSITIGKIVWAVLIFLAALFVFKYLVGFLELFAERWTNLRLLIKRLIPIVRVTGWMSVVYFIIVDIFAPPIQTLIAVTASAGIAIGFASQDILKNIFGGIMIILDRPFQVGDKIQVGQHYGEVVQIGLRSVRIVTPDDSLVSIPNGDLINQSVSNSNAGEFNCQVVAEFFLPPDIDFVKLKKIAYRAAAVSRYVYLNKPITVIISNEINEGRSLLKVRLKAYVLDLRYEFPFASDMTEIVITELLRQNLISASDLALTSERTRHGTIKP
ncbi:MAG TPA: mechanosensitive ion channel domain-containing protein [Anaerolineae bacterium]|nr:mechanosensitive ion channel domain-containing protein [Anaerolineae bacterium]